MNKEQSGSTRDQSLNHSRFVTLTFSYTARWSNAKQRLRAILPKSQSVLFCDYIEAAGEKLFALACKRDLEGIVAKHKFGPYLQDLAQWLKIRNPKYSQWACVRRCALKG